MYGFASLDRTGGRIRSWWRARGRGLVRFRVLVLLLVMIVVGALVWSFCRQYPSRKKIRNVLLISIDTCRADYLGCYGCLRPTTPHIDALAREGILFKNVVSPVPLTLPAHSSMLTGTNPPYHGVHHNEEYRLGESNVTLAEVLKDNGFVTGAIVSSFVLDSRFGLSQGFDTYDDSFDEGFNVIGVAERRGGEASRHAVRWLAEHGNEPFFLFLHYFDPHDIYDPPEPFASKFPDNPYAGEIVYTDDCIGQVIAQLKALALYDSTLIIVTSDHGEMLGEHNEPTHSYFIYESAVKVPLVFKLPGRVARGSVGGVVGLIDIVPTVCSLVGIEPPADVQGEDLSGYFEDGQHPDQVRCVYCESLTPTFYGVNSLLGVVTDRWKYIQTTRPELYDWVQDPQESNNLVANEPRRAALLQERLRQILRDQLREVADSKAAVDSESRKRLESLGYVGGGDVSENFEFDQSKDDPKDWLDFFKLDKEVLRLCVEKRHEEAKNLGEKMVQQRPTYEGGHRYLGKIAMEEGNYPGAVDHLRRALEVKPADAETRYHLGLALGLLGRLDEAVAHLNKAVHLKPDFAEAHNYLGRILTRQRKLDEALEHFQEAEYLRPDWPVPLNEMAWILATRPDGVVRDGRRAVELAKRASELTHGRSAAILDTLAAAYAAAGEFEMAVTTAQAAITEASAAQASTLAEAIGKRLELYRQGRPYQEVVRSRGDVRP